MKKYVVEKFTVGDTDDPYVATQNFIYEWNQSLKGEWCKSNTLESLKLESYRDIKWGDYHYAIIALLNDEKITEFILRFNNDTQ